MTGSPEIFHLNGIKPPDLLLTHALRRGGVIYDLDCRDKAAAIRAVCDVLPWPAKVDREELRQAPGGSDRIVKE